MSFICSHVRRATGAFWRALFFFLFLSSPEYGHAVPDTSQDDGLKPVDAGGLGSKGKPITKVPYTCWPRSQRGRGRGRGRDDEPTGFGCEQTFN